MGKAPSPGRYRYEDYPPDPPYTDLNGGDPLTSREEMLLTWADQNTARWAYLHDCEPDTFATMMVKLKGIRRKRRSDRRWMDAARAAKEQQDA